MIIGIDPGHGGFDPGAIGQMGTMEKDITLAISLLVSEALRDAGLGVVLTRTADTTVGNIRDVNKELEARTYLFNNVKVDYAVSVHINSSLNREADYISTFIQGRGGEAEKLAEKIQTKLVDVTGWSDGGIRVLNLHMTRVTKMPAVVVECGFISNLKQEEQLRDPIVQNKIAQAIAEGILDYLGKEIVKVPDWKEQIMLDAAKAGLIDGNHGHNADEPADKWFVLAVMLNMLKGGKQHD